jgi:hypothetical protein
VGCEVNSQKLDRTDIICGYPAKKIRDFLGGNHGAFRYDDTIGPEHFAAKIREHFGVDAEAVAVELFKRGWVERTEVSNAVAADSGILTPNKPIVALTQIGKQSRIISLNKRFPRAAGEVIVTDLIARAKVINANHDLLCGVNELRLFGSMLDPKAETVGDVDVAFELYQKEPPPGFGKDYPWVEWNIQRANQCGGEYLQYQEKMSYGEREVRRLLRSGKSRLSMQQMYYFDELKPAPKFKMIFKADRKSLSKKRKTAK